MKTTAIEDVLKEFGLTDEQILVIACTKTLGDGVNMLKAAINDKWNMDTSTVTKVVKLLKDQLK